MNPPEGCPPLSRLLRKGGYFDFLHEFTTESRSRGENSLQKPFKQQWRRRNEHGATSRLGLIFFSLCLRVSVVKNRRDCLRLRLLPAEDAGNPANDSPHRQFSLGIS